MKLTLWKLAIPALASVVVAPLAFTIPAQAERLANPVAEFSGIDKITGRITTFDVYVNETVQFGALQVTPKVCYSRDETEAQKIDSFIEVDEITLDRKIRRIFSGWMFADSPALNAVEHPIYDVWLTGCKDKSDVEAPPGVKPTHPAPEPAKAQAAPATDGAAQGAGTPSAPATPEMVAPVDGQPAAPTTIAPTDAPLTDGPPPDAPGAVPPLDAPTNVPPLDAPQDIQTAPLDQAPLGQAPVDQAPVGQQPLDGTQPYGTQEPVPGDLIPPADVPVDGDPLYQNNPPLYPGEPVPQGQPAAPPGGVGLY